jgi:hypothetical protein
VNILKATVANRQGFVGLEKPTMKPVSNPPQRASGTGKYPPTMDFSLKIVYPFVET